MSHFAKRHYEAVALAIQEATRLTQYPKHNDAALVGIAAAISELANTFACDNHLFNRKRFIRACEPGANVRKRT